MKRKIILFVLVMISAGCNMPVTTVKTEDVRPCISILDAPEDAVLLVDGLLVGKAASYNGNPNMLTVEPGTHRIVVKQGSNVLYEQQIFVDSENKRIRIR